MKDTKSLTLLLLSSVLFLLSIILLCTWGYQYYHQIQEDKNKMQQLAVKPSSAVADDTRDSLLKIYQVTLNSLGNNADTAYNAADSLKGQLNVNLQEFYRLRDEIAVLLQSQTPKAEDIVLAKRKITELQLRVDQLKYRNTDIEKENERLKAVIDQLSKAKNNAGEDNEGSVVKEQVATASPAAQLEKSNPGIITAVNLNLNAVADKNNTETITNDITTADKLVGTFTVKNSSANNGWCDLMVVVKNPQGQVIQKSAWESGMFETPGGKRIYSVKIRCETGKGQAKQVSFSLNADNYPKGSYTMLVYHEGKVIGRATKILS